MGVSGACWPASPTKTVSSRARESACLKGIVQSDRAEHPTSGLQDTCVWLHVTHTESMPDVVTHDCNASADDEVEARGLKVQGQPGPSQVSNSGPCTKVGED